MTVDISVVIPCYCQAHLLPEALDSVVTGHPAVDVEVVVVDDGSPDDVQGVVSRYPGVRLVSQANAGLSAARNAGILASTGPLLLFLDSDDYVRPGMLTTAVAAMRDNPDVDVVHGYADVIEGTDARVVTEFGRTDLGADALHRLLRRNLGPPNTFVVRRSVLSRAGLFDPSLRSCEDWDMWIRIASAGGRFLSLPEMRSVYRLSPMGMSQNLERMWTSGAAALGKQQSWHAGCVSCRKSVRAGKRWFGEGLLGLTRQGLRSRSSASATLRVLARHPPLAVIQLLAGFGWRIDEMRA